MKTSYIALRAAVVDGFMDAVMICAAAEKLNIARMRAYASPVKGRDTLR